MNNSIKFINKTTAQVTKAFMKKAVIFGTPEYKLWRDYKKDYPNAEMTVKRIKRDPEKSCRNLTYDKIRKYLTDNGTKTDLANFEKVIKMSVIQNSPYHYVIDWFKKTFEDYKDCPIFSDSADEAKENLPFAKVASM